MDVKLSALILLVCVFLGIQAAPLTTMNMTAMMYLHKFGYVDMAVQMMNMTSNNYSEDVMVMAMKEFQGFMGIKMTGEMDNDTMEAMMKPRCGQKDIVGNRYPSRTKRYAHGGTRWNGDYVTYRISRMTEKMHPSKVLEDIRRATEMWSRYTHLKFYKTSRRSATVDIRFDSREHGDGSPFDGPGGVLAHATYPTYNGFMHFDEEESWTNAYHGRNLYQVALHEFGHTLGLDHSSEKRAIMFPTIRDNDPNAKLHWDDIIGLEALYGRRFGRLESDSNSSTTAPDIIVDEELCKDPSIDTMFTNMEGELIVFKGDKYYVLADDGGIMRGYPKPINKTWPKLVSKIDAAFTYNDNYTYFLKGSQIWRYRNFTLDKGYPKLITREYPGVPSNIDTAMEWAPNGNLYFFKDDRVWCAGSGFVEPGSLSFWRGVPSKLSSAFYYKGHTHFIKGSQYYLFEEASRAVARDDPPYPRDVGRTWFGCSGEVRNLTTPNGGLSCLLVSQSFLLLSSILIALLHFI